MANEETGTSRCETPIISVSNTHDKCTAHRTKDSNADLHVTSKRRRTSVVVSEDDDENTFKVNSKHKTDMIKCHNDNNNNNNDNNNNNNNVVSSTTAVTRSTSHHHAVISSFLCSVNHDSIPDLKAKCIPETGIFISINKSFRDVSKTSTMICSEPEELVAVATNEAITSCRNKPSPIVVAKMPSAEELEEFFAKAEKYEQKRFAEKYNFDIVKDVPIEGRYQWIKLKP